MRNAMMNMMAKATTAMLAATAILGVMPATVEACETTMHQEPFEFLDAEEDSCEWYYDEDSWMKGDFSWKMAPCEID